MWASDWDTVNVRGGVRTSCASSPARQWDPHKSSLPQRHVKASMRKRKQLRESSHMKMFMCFSRPSFSTFSCLRRPAVIGKL